MGDKIKRLLAAMIDFYIICFLSTGFIGILTLGEFSVTPFSVITYFVLYLLFLLIKDVLFQNASVGKRLLKLKLVKTDGGKITIINIIKRNIPLLVLLPIEVYLIIVNNKRIGDIWAKTSVDRRF